MDRYWTDNDNGVEINDVETARKFQQAGGSLADRANLFIADYNRKQKRNQKAGEWINSDSVAFDGWTDADKQSFLRQYSEEGWTDSELKSAQLWQSAQIARRNANARAEADRNDILAEIEAYKAGFSNEHIEMAVAGERQAWNAKIESTLQQAVQQAAAQGRVIDAFTYSILRGRLEAQAAGAVQKVQMDYENKRQEYILNALSLKNDVYKNSTRAVEDTTDVAAVIRAMAGK